MKTAIVYYSMSGNTEYTARAVASGDADLIEIRPEKAYPDKGFRKFFWGGKSAVMAEKPELEPYEADLAAYDRIIIGFPVWASNFTPPIRTFLQAHLQELSQKRIAAFACQSGAGAEKALAKLKKAAGVSDFEATGVFIDPKQKHTEMTDRAIDAFVDALKQE